MLPTAPYDYSTFDEWLKKPGTRDRYITEWERFVEYAKITSNSGFGNNMKSEELLHDYLKMRRTTGDGVLGTSLAVFLSRISTVITYFYRFEVSKVRSLNNSYLRFCTKYF